MQHGPSSQLPGHVQLPKLSLSDYALVFLHSLTWYLVWEVNLEGGLSEVLPGHSSLRFPYQDEGKLWKVHNSKNNRWRTRRENASVLVRTDAFLVGLLDDERDQSAARVFHQVADHVVQCGTGNLMEVKQTSEYTVQLWGDEPRLTASVPVWTPILNASCAEKRVLSNRAQKHWTHTQIRGDSCNCKDNGTLVIKKYHWLFSVLCLPAIAANMKFLIHNCSL